MDNQITEDKNQEYITTGLEIRERADNMSWSLGDLANLVVLDYGKKYLKEFAKAINIDPSTLSKYRIVAEKFNQEDRDSYPQLSFTHFRIVQNHPEKYILLKKASEELWTVQQLKFACTGAKEVLPKKPPMAFCMKCMLWYIKDNSNSCQTGGKCE